jgi:hypothetical protein
VNPTPITEAERIPDIDEIIDVHLFANRLVELEEPLHALYRDDETEVVADKIVTGGRRIRRHDDGIRSNIGKRLVEIAGDRCGGPLGVSVAKSLLVGRGRLRHADECA